MPLVKMDYLKSKKSRLIVREGNSNVLLNTSDILLIYSQNKIAYVLDKNGKKYISDKNLFQLELELDEKIFFRANRQYIISINFIKGYKSYKKVKLIVQLQNMEINHTIVISQVSASKFKTWLVNS